VTNDFATHPQKLIHVWMADMIVQKIEAKNQFCLFVKKYILTILTFSFLISFRQHLKIN